MPLNCRARELTDSGDHQCVVAGAEDGKQDGTV